ncbi:TRAP transporter substrate-binding protein DctP [Azospirillum sp.]|uniref:TRAP transporter substrate-binding protein DctP n=1 Tax=Azospirillum sp. TaxID=34012 RepID=UPI002D656E9A|nr:TRAP transporter substrate-binding protein DctP [Azospirillum sp.]HYD66305.1 TRAP transporter substrate-binding protein DctP [Azospirillum sp.]
MWNPRNVLASAVLAAGVALSGTAGAAEPLKISHQWKAETDARDRAARLFTKEVEKRAPDLKFRIYPGRSLIQNPLAQIDALQAGQVEMSIFPLVYAVGKVPEFSITILPGLIRGFDQAVALKGSPYHKRLQEIAHENGIHIVTWWWTPGGFAAKDREMKGPESVQGMKMRAADPYFEAMLQDAGASVHAMASTEIYSALQTGVLDGLLTSSESLVSMRIYEQAKNATVGGKNEIFLLIQPLVMAKSAWDKLTPQQQKAFEEAATVSETYFNEEQKKAHDDLRKAWEKAGGKVRELTDAEYDAWVALAKKTAWPKFETEVKGGKSLVQVVQESVQKTN